jgi:hypothetical protein
MRRLAAVFFLFAALIVSTNASLKAVAFAPPTVVPSGERVLGQTTIEPAYNADTGQILYLLTPMGAPFPSKANYHAVSPLYLVVYPHSAADAVGPMNCAFETGDNCPDHGQGIANLAAGQFGEPGVYGAGVWGHDHIVDPPGGADFNIAWHVVVVLFTDNATADTHLTTEAQIDAVVASGHAREIETPIVFNCNVVPAVTYWRGTPVTPVPPALWQRPRP